ncbi:hypothetical protein ACFQ0O_27975 [Saccharopolyspora spinosporotrichia]
MFLPGTVFRVMGVDSGPRKSRVLLAEVPPGWDISSESGERRATRIRTKLDAAATARESLYAADPVAEDQERFAALPGVLAIPTATNTRSAS